MKSGYFLFIVLFWTNQVKSQSEFDPNRIYSIEDILFDTSFVKQKYLANNESKYKLLGDSFPTPGNLYNVFKNKINSRRFLIIGGSELIEIVPNVLQVVNFSFKRRYIDSSEFNYYFWSVPKVESLKKKYGTITWKYIMKGQVLIGWDEKICRLSWGDPDKVNTTITKSNVTQQWVYGNRYLYFTNGKLTTIQN